MELFYSLQGEGRYAGTPSLFIRLGGCNLGCPGFGCLSPSPRDGSLLQGCDTLRAVDKKHFGHLWRSFEDSNELKAACTKLLADERAPARWHCVITGGEPVLHFTNPILYDLITWLVDCHIPVTIETNATVPIDFTRYPAYTHLFYSMSVKLANSGEAYDRRVRPEVITSYATHGTEAWLKFVVSRHNLDAQVAEIKAISSIAPAVEVYLMPLGSTPSELEANAPAVFELCRRHGWRYSDRIHIRLFGNRGGI